MDSLKIGDLNKAPAVPHEKGKQKDGVDFAKALKGAISEVNRLDSEGDRSIVDLLQGKTGIHETMVALQKADISMRLVLAIRNKVLEAYREIMRMQF